MTRCPNAVMLAAMLCMAAWLPITSAAGENTEHRRQLLRDAYQDPVAFSPKAARFRYIPTNTLAFREYALNAMLAQANEVNAQWQLGLPAPLTSDHVVRLFVTAMMHGVAGGITISNRFYFSFRDGALSDYHDSDYWRQDAGRDLSRMDQLAKQRSLITVEEAAQIASAAFRSLGLAPNQFRLLDQPFTEQYKYENRDDQKLLLPLYLVEWKSVPHAQFGGIRMEVSGLTRKVVNYENPHPIPGPMPTNYFQLLGISPNREEWGRQYGYDPMHSAAFDQFARSYLVEQFNRVINLWQLDAPRSFGTNDLVGFRTTPHTNGPAAYADFTNRFYLQIGEGHIQLFQDREHDQSAFDESSGKLTNSTLMAHTLDERTVIDLARKALHQLGLNETQLRLVEPPKVTQSKQLDATEDQAVKLPLYDVLWTLPPSEHHRLGAGSGVGFQISAVTRRVTMYGNSIPWTPALPLPTNYLQILGPAALPPPTPVTLPRNPKP